MPTTTDTFADTVRSLRRYGADPYYRANNPRYTLRDLMRPLLDLLQEPDHKVSRERIENLLTVLGELEAHLDAQVEFQKRAAVVFQAIADELDPERTIVYKALAE